MGDDPTPDVLGDERDPDELEEQGPATEDAPEPQTAGADLFVVVAANRYVLFRAGARIPSAYASLKQVPAKRDHDGSLVPGTARRR